MEVFGLQMEELRVDLLVKVFGRVLGLCHPVYELMTSYKYNWVSARSDFGEIRQV